MKNVLVIVLCLVGLSAFAQKEKEEKIEYYTDSDVHHSIVSIQMGYMPFYSNRRLLAESANPGQAFVIAQNSTTGQYGQAYGGDILFKVNQSLEVGVGLYNSYANYTWDFVQFLDAVNGNGDSLNGTYRVDMMANYLNVPISFGFVTQLADQWWLQVYPALELNFLQQLERTYRIDDPNLKPENDEGFGDITNLGTDFNLTVNFGLGGEYRVLEKLGIFTRLQFRYMFYEIVKEAPVREVIYTVGGHLGVRYYF